MPRYFFDLRGGFGPGKLTRDQEGDEMPEHAVREHAIDIARKLVRTRAHSVRDWLNCSFEIADEQGRPVMTVPFADMVSDADRAEET